MPIHRSNLIKRVRRKIMKAKPRPKLGLLKPKRKKIKSLKIF